MFKKILIIICFFLISVIAPGWAIATDKNKVLKAYYFHRPPYYIKLDDGKASGFLVEITKMIFDIAEIHHILIETPPKRILKLIEQDKYSCSIGWFKTLERESFALFSDPIYQNMSTGIVLRRSVSSFAEKPKLNQIMKSQLVLGIVEGFSYGSEIDDAILRLKPSMFSICGEVEGLLRMIQDKRIAYAFIAPEEANYFLTQNQSVKPDLQFKEIADMPKGNIRYLMFNKNIELDLINKVNASIKTVKNTQKYMDLVSFEKSKL